MAVAFGFDPRKHLFFDEPAIIRRLDRGTLRFLRTAGGTVRKVARRSIRRRRATSLPGRPPSSHGAGRLRSGIRFGVDPQRDLAVVGPVPYRARSGPENGAAILEFGSKASIGATDVEAPTEEELAAAPKRDNRGRFLKKKRRPRSRVKYAARPYMRPALDTVTPRLPRMWADSFR